MKTVFVSLRMSEEHKKKLEKAGAGCRFLYRGSEGVDTNEALRQAEVIIGNIRLDRLQIAEKLELLQLNTSGAAEFTAPGVLRPGVLLCSATGAYGCSVSEHALAATLMLQKNLHLYRDAQSEGRWADYGQVQSIGASTVLVVGLGDIGLRYARMAKALGAYVIGVKRRGGETPEGVDELRRPDELMELLPRADVVASFLPGTKDTAYLYTMEHFKAMKNSAVFVNCGRGNAVAGEVLNEALEQGEIFAASVDVTEVEPLPADSPLWKQKKLLLTPHVSGGYRHAQTLDMIVDIACKNLDAYLNGGELISLVDFETGYKK